MERLQHLAMRVVAVVQARMRSSRLPCKICLDLAGEPALQRCLTRVARIGGVNEVVVATSAEPDDDVTVSVTKRLGFRAVRGSESDVLSRYTAAAKETQADVVVRCTSDCPLLDPTISSLVVRTFLERAAGRTPVDYVSNTLSRVLPRGLDTEVFSAEALLRADRLATAPHEREHVTARMYLDRDNFSIAEAVPAVRSGLGELRWTLDTLEDYRFLHHVTERLGSRASEADMDEVLALLARHPELLRINADVVQKSV